MTEEAQQSSGSTCGVVGIADKVIHGSDCPVFVYRPHLNTPLVL